MAGFDDVVLAQLSPPNPLFCEQAQFSFQPVAAFRIEFILQAPARVDVAGKDFPVAFSDVRATIAPSHLNTCT
jgi:hypothetical protein